MFIARWDHKLSKFTADSKAAEADSDREECDRGDGILGVGDH